MELWFYVLVFRDAAIGFVVGLSAALLARRVAPDARATRVVTAVAAAVVLALQLLLVRWFAWPWEIPSWMDRDFHLLRLLPLVAPLVLGVVLVVAVTWGPRPTVGGVAPLARRGIRTFTRPWPLVTLGVLLAAAIGLALAGGFASRPDDEGRYTMFQVELSPDTGFGSTIYGWFFSVPALGVVAVLAAAVVGALALAVRRPLGTDPDAELARRRSRTRAVLAAAGGALLLHLAAVLAMFARTASVVATFSAGTIGAVRVVGPFDALGPALDVTAAIAASLGYALWWFVLLAAIVPPRRGARAS